MDAAVTAAKSDLGVLEIQTKKGDLYYFPAMSWEAVKQVLPNNKEEPAISQPMLALVNASYSVLSIPFRIVKTISFDGKQVWECPA